MLYQFFLLILLFSCCPLSAIARHAHQEKILICGVCKDVEAALPNTIRNIEKLGGSFKDYHVIIYENNSTDRTPEILKNWAHKNKHVSLFSEKLSQEDFNRMEARCLSYDGKPSRMELIARARNIVLHHARASKFAGYRYLLMADLDFQGKWPIAEIVRTVGTNRPWDCVSANGIDPDGHYYDNYALRDERHPIGPELIGASWWSQEAPWRIKLSKKRGWHPVYSAFGGLAIYKRAAILTSSYTGSVTKELEKEYRAIIRQTSWSNYYFKKYREYMGITAKVAFTDTPVRFQINSGYYHFPVCCEHVTLHASMCLKGHSRMYINPKMVMRYNVRNR